MSLNNNVDIAQRKLFLETKLRESGEEQRLEEYLRHKLIESGWKDELKNHCKEMIRKKGLEKVTVEELVEELTIKGRNTVPMKVKEDLLARIKTYFEDEGFI
jgi:hypothetical protein